MALDAASATSRPRIELSSSVELTCFALCVAQGAYLLASLVQGSWVLDAAGQPIATDFVNIWSGGYQFMRGADVGAIYDVQLHKDAEAAALGHDFPGEYPWLYPPTFLLIAGALALLPIIPAYALWVTLTFAGYVASVRGIIEQRVAILLACAYPGVLSNLIVGQNGFLSAALFGAGLLFLERRPVLAGCFIGLLSFKPHLGILFPIILVAGRHWRAFAAAVATTVLLVLASCAAVGFQAWAAFFHALPAASQTTLVEGRAEWGKLQSVFALTRLLGGGEALGWTLQLGLAFAVATLLYRLWCSSIRYDLKAAGLAVGTLLVTPYLFLYDLVLLAIAMAFLIRAAAAGGDARADAWGIGCASLLVLLFPFVKVPVGLPAVLLVAFLVLRRALGLRSILALQPA